MSLATGVRAALIADAAVLALAGQRVYRSGLPQKPDYPCVVFLRQQTSRANETLDGCGLSYVQMDIHCYAKDGDDKDSLADAVKAVLDNHRGDLGGADILLCTLTDEQDDLFVENDLRLHIKAFTFEFILRE